MALVLALIAATCAPRGANGPSPTPPLPLARLSLYVAATDGGLSALAAATGTRRWRFATGGAIVAAPTVADGLVFTGSNDGFVYALRSRDGTLAWRTSVGNFVVSTPVLVAGLVIVTTIEGTVIALDARTGKPRWRRTPIPTCIPAAHTQSDQIIFYGTNCGQVLAMRARDGATLWARQPGTASTLVSTFPVLAGATLYVGIGQGTTAPGGAVAALRASDGRLEWRFANVKAGFSRPAVGDDAVFASADNATVFALRRESGQLLWTYGAAEAEISPPALDSAGVYAAVGSTLVALEARTGQPHWLQPLAGVAPAAPLVADDFLFIGAGDRYTQAVSARATANGAVRWQVPFPRNTAVALTIGP